MAFADDLGMFGFQFSQERRDGTRVLSLARNRFLSYSLHLPPDGGSALFTWEFAIGEYLTEYGMQLGASEPLNQFLFPQQDHEVAQDLAEVVRAMERVETSFRAMDFGSPSL